MNSSPVLGVAIGALVLTGCGAPRPVAHPLSAAPPAAEQLRLSWSTVADLKPVGATLTTRDMTDARARISGVLASLAVKAGDEVRRGQLVGVVRDERIGLQTGAYDAQVRAADAEAVRASADLARTRDLFDHGVYARARLEQVEAAAKVANGQLAAARAQRAASGELAAQGAILAPAAGKVLTADVPAGSVVMAGQSIARITAGPLVVRLELPEGDARALKLGEVVRLDRADLGGAADHGVVAEVYPRVSDGQVEADVAAPALPAAFIGKRVRAFVALGQRRALIAPRRFIETLDGVDYALLAGPGGAVSPMPVEVTAGPTADTLELLSGLRAGDVIVAPKAKP